QGEAGRPVAAKQGAGRNAIALDRHSGAGRNPVTMWLGFREKPAWPSFATNLPRGNWIPACAGMTIKRTGGCSKEPGDLPLSFHSPEFAHPPPIQGTA